MNLVTKRGTARIGLLLALAVLAAGAATGDHR
jgi:hypothetical protein